jgi:hypothetical protein
MTWLAAWLISVKNGTMGALLNIVQKVKGCDATM